MKRGIIKGFTERAKRLCDEEHLEDELQNVEDVFVANGYRRELVKKYMEEENKINSNKEKDKEIRGVVNIPYLKNVSEKFKRIAKRHNFMTAFKPGHKIKEIKSKAQIPLGKKKKEAIYKIPCKCTDYVYIGETWRMTETREGEHKANVRLTKKDIEEGRLESAEARMNKEDGGLPKHSTICNEEIDWENTKVIAQEKGRRQRKVREGIESLREIHNKKRVLNIYDKCETWQPVLKKFFKDEKT